MNELMNIYTHVDVFLIIFCRIICAVVFLPVINETKIPKLAVSGLCICLALITYLSMGTIEVQYNPTLLGFTFVIVKEGIVGLIIGFAFKIYFQIYAFVGSLWSTQGGLSMVNAMDPTSNTQVATVGRLYNLTFGALFIFSGGYHWFIQTVVESFRIVPINEAIFTTNISGYIIAAVADYFIIAFKLAMPILGILIVIDCSMGILARTVPQMNMFVIGIPLKMIVLYFILMITVTLIPSYNKLITDGLVDMIMSLIQEMRPL